MAVRLLAKTFADRIESGGVVLRHFYNSKRQKCIEQVDALVWFGRQTANDGIARELEEAGISNIRIIGDAMAPRRLPNVIQEAYNAAAAITLSA